MAVIGAASTLDPTNASVLFPANRSGMDPATTRGFDNYTFCATSPGVGADNPTNPDVRSSAQTRD